MVRLYCTPCPVVVNLDFEARVPVPFSIFPSTYRDSEVQTQTIETKHEELELHLPTKHQAGREGEHSSISVNAEPPRREHFHKEEEASFTHEEEHYHRPGVHHEYHIHESHRPSPPQSDYTSSHVHVDNHHHHHHQLPAPQPQKALPFSSPLDVAERQYREHFRPHHHHQHHHHHHKPTFSATVDAPPRLPQQQFHHHQPDRVEVDYSVEGRNIQSHRTPNQLKYESDETVESSTSYVPRSDQKSNMGYYDEDGHYHSFRSGVHKLADKIAHPRGHSHSNSTQSHVDYDEMKKGPSASGPHPRPGDSAEAYLPNTVTIPCHHIRMGDFLMLQGRPCQVIRISTSSATGQYRYLGVDLFSKQLHEESSFISNPAPSVVVQTMLGPVFKQYRVLDMSEGVITAMTETGDVKSGLTVIDQSNLYSRLQNAFESGRGSVRVLVLNDNGQELAVDMKVIHGSRL
ncbi:hypothetical protein N3K66_000676 [Trichothecium roseum]|uniref:Uncharacterized protein n=1 Tax=Trichothecium roseum TaxID=47278 RepID=A0ACC0VE42_9HYPO|nr:hypothetical protein N3K66_000676 [Trichothecium roseum]